MEEHSKKIEKFTEKWVKEAGLEQPSSSFMDTVMTRIEQKSAQSSSYRPLISFKGWGLVAAVLIASIAILYLLPNGGMTYLEGLNIEGVPAFKNPFAEMEVSRNTVYAFGFLALFLLQIPFLKRKFAS